MKTEDTYEIVIGLEVHAQLLTASKLFCSDAVSFGAEPNTNISPVSLAHPGTLPKMNKKAIEMSIRLGLACHSEIEQENYFARKNYFYPDLPKGYQLSQHTTPICKNGFVNIRLDQKEKKIKLNRIHMEEDAGKSLHDVYENKSALDFNRAGTALVEIVTEPDLRSGEEAFVFLTELRKLVRYLEICDGNMEEGSLRCDANISVRKKGDEKLGTKVEIKNLNSIRNVKRAIECEAERMITMLEGGKIITQQTRGFDSDIGVTFSIRDKEDADDYRYFPDPDLSPFHITAEFINSIKETIPLLQEERIEKYKKLYQLSDYDARTLTDEKEFSDYFEEVIIKTNHYKSVANWMLGPVKSWLNEKNTSINEFPLDAGKLASVIDLVESRQLNFSTASTKLFSYLLIHPGADPRQVAKEQNLIQVSDSGFIEPIIEAVLNKFSDKVMEYKKGKKGLMGLFVGEVMKQSKGKADPNLVNDILKQKLNS